MPPEYGGDMPVGVHGYISVSITGKVGVFIRVPVSSRFLDSWSVLVSGLLCPGCTRVTASSFHYKWSKVFQYF